MKPADLPAAEHFAHGSRARYVSGCRCAPCTTANRLYARARSLAKVRGDSNGLVPAERARKHLLELRRSRVGARAVASASDVALNVIKDLVIGRQTQLRAATERRILAVDAKARSDHALVRSGASWAAVKQLLKLGLTQGEIARRMGSKAKVPALQLGGKWVTAANEYTLSRLLREEKRKREVCRCGLRHDDDPTAAAYCARNVVTPADVLAAPKKIRRAA